MEAMERTQAGAVWKHLCILCSRQAGRIEWERHLTAKERAKLLAWTAGDEEEEDAADGDEGAMEDKARKGLLALPMSDDDD